MAPRPISERIAQLEARTKALKARHANEERVKETRRKVLLGAMVINSLDDPAFAKTLRTWLECTLPKFLTREQDQALFEGMLTTESHEASVSSLKTAS